MEEQKKPLSRGAKIIIVLSAVLLVVIGVIIFYYNRIVLNPRQLFEQGPPTPAPSSAPTPAPSSGGATAEVPTPSPTLSPYEQLLAQADTSMMKDIVNVLLIGVDYAEERETWRGKKAYHADVMIVVAINFQENRADMISLPRDTYADIPGVDGIYKLNASVDCGGGFPEGLHKVAESASWMLGGIPVDYYYAVTMPVVKELVDTIGGVDYDVDVSFRMMGRSYQKGMQHLDGQGVLDYFRVRKNVAQGGDLNRINRQKKLLIAIFETMQQQNLLVTLPQLVTAFDGKLLTNTTLEQTAALGVFAYGLKSENIGMHSMDGPMRNIFNWNFCLTDQGKRVGIIKDIYGIDVPKNNDYSPSGAQSRWNQMRSKKFYSNAENVIAAAEKYLSASPAPPTSATPTNATPTGATPTDAGSTPSPSPSGTPGPTPSPSAQQGATPTPTPSAAAATTPLPKLFAAVTTTDAAHIAQVRAQLSATRDALKACKSNLSDTNLSALQSETTKLAGLIGYSGLGWQVGYTNEIDVDAR